MENKGRNQLKKLTSAIFPVAAALAVIWMMLEMRPIDGMIGHDYSLLFFRMLISSADFWQNGWQVLHYTAAACGGIGIFADPQSMAYSLVQFISFKYDPWIATQITLNLFHIAGYWSFYRLAQKRFQLSSSASHLGSLLFILNGFTFAHLYVGHLTHHTYFLLPLVLDLILRPYRERREQIGNMTFLVLILSYLIYSGSLHMIAVFGCAILLLIPHWILVRHREGQLKVGLLCMAVTLAVTLACAAAKIYAVSSYSPLFMIRGMDLSGENPWTILMRYFYFLPGQTPQTIPWGEYLFGAWEYVAFVSKLTIPLIGLFLWTQLKSVDPIQRIVYSITAVLAIELALLGTGWGGNEFLPFFRSYHNPIKLLAAFIPFICLFSAMGFSRLETYGLKYDRSFHSLLALFFIGVIGFETYTYTSYFTEKGVGLGYAYKPQLYYDAQAHGRLPQIRSVVINNNDWDSLAAAATNWNCYEPLLGYKGEKKGRELRVGPVDTIFDGRFNLTHPGCLVYPDHFQCKRWDRIPAKQSEDFINFTLGRKVSWGVPPTQQALIWLSLTVLGITFGMWLFIHLVWLRRRFRK